MVQNNKNTYEAMFLVDAATATEKWERVLGAIEKIMQRSQAEVLSISKWDERRLSYPISGHNRGTYLLSYFKAPPEALDHIERDAQLDETILRLLILRADRIPQEIIEQPTPFALAQQQKQAAAARSEQEKAPPEAEPEEDFDSYIPDVTKVDEIPDVADETEPETGDILESLTEADPEKDKQVDFETEETLDPENAPE